MYPTALSALRNAQDPWQAKFAFFILRGTRRQNETRVIDRLMRANAHLSEIFKTLK